MHSHLQSGGFACFVIWLPTLSPTITHPLVQSRRPWIKWLRVCPKSSGNRMTKKKVSRRLSKWMSLNKHLVSPNYKPSIGDTIINMAWSLSSRSLLVESWGYKQANIILISLADSQSRGEPSGAEEGHIIAVGIVEEGKAAVPKRKRSYLLQP